MQNRAAKAVIKHKVNQKMSGNNNNGDKCQCVLGSFTTTFGVITNACGAGVGIGALAFLGEPTTSTSDTRIALMFIGNSLSLTLFCLMLLASFALPNERYAILFGFLQLAVGKALLMAFASILMIAAGLVFMSVPGKEWIGILIFVAAGFEIAAMCLVIARSCCYDNKPDMVWSGNPSSSSKSSNKRASRAANVPVERNNGGGGGGQEFGGNSPGYSAPQASQPKTAPPVDDGAEFGSDNPFGAPERLDCVA